MMSSNRFVASCIALGLAIYAATGASAQTTATAPASFTLANGLQVVVIPDHRTPVVTQMIWYKVGSADETPGKSGLAHFLEHLMFKGTAKNPAGRFSQEVASIGGQENAFTANDYTITVDHRTPGDEFTVEIQHRVSPEQLPLNRNVHPMHRPLALSA